MSATPSPHRALALAVFLGSFLASGLSLARHQQLGAMAGMTDEWYFLGTNLRVFGVLGVGDDVIVSRPPGYPLFVAAALLPANEPGRPTFAAYLARGERSVYLAQALLLGATASLLYYWMRRRIPSGTAFLAALLFGANPYSVLLVGLLHYDVLHLFVTVASCLIFEWAVAAARRRPLAMTLSGAAWGIVTLVRPMTFTLPPLLLLLLLRHGLRRALTDGAWLSVGALAVVAPWTARNYAVAGRMIPVNAQGWIALWGTTVEPLGFDPNHYYWDELYVRDFLPIYARTTGESHYTFQTFNRRNAELQEAFRTEALRNLRERPGIYARNAARSFLTLGLQINSIFLDVFREGQDPQTLRAHWYFGPEAKPYEPSGLATSFTLFVGLLTLLGAGGLAAGAFARDDWLLVPLLGYLSLALAHSLVYMDLMYYYVKLPFLFLFAFYALGRLPDRPRRALGAIVAISGLALTAVTLW